MDLDFKDEGLIACLNSQYFIDVFQSMNNDTVDFSFIDISKRCMIMCKDTQGFFRIGNTGI
jgi:hypothetical protein